MMQWGCCWALEMSLELQLMRSTCCWKLDQLVLQMKRRAQNRHACTVPVSKREHEDGHKEHATSLVLPSKQNLYSCICERQYPLS